jgi:hypothetical protein
MIKSQKLQQRNHHETKKPEHWAAQILAAGTRLQRSCRLGQRV